MSRWLLRDIAHNILHLLRPSAVIPREGFEAEVVRRFSKPDSVRVNSVPLSVFSNLNSTRVVGPLLMSALGSNEWCQVKEKSRSRTPDPRDWRLQFNIRLHVRPPVIQEHGKELAGYATTKAIVRFATGKPVPMTLVKKLVRASLKAMKDKRSNCIKT